MSFLAGMYIGNATSSSIDVKHHNLYCGKIVEQGVLFCELDFVAQDAVLSCPHRSHAAVQILFRTFCDTKATETPEEGKLF
mgnify:CR=1 FL=1